MMIQIGFGLVAAALIFAALQVVTTRNLVHSVLWLGATLITTAVLFVLLQAPFLAAVQLLLYTGGVLTLMLFGIMMTRREQAPEIGLEVGLEISNSQTGRARGAITAAVIFGVIAAAIYKTGPALPIGDVEPPGTAALGRSFLSTHVLAFEVLSVLLLAAMVGAIVLGRRRDAAPADDAMTPAERVRARQQALTRPEARP